MACHPSVPHITHPYYQPNLDIQNYKRILIAYQVYIHPPRYIRLHNVTSKKRKKLSGKKDSQLVIRINGRERDEFVSLCDELDTSAAREIRKFIRRFLTEHQEES